MHKICIPKLIISYSCLITKSTPHKKHKYYLKLNLCQQNNKNLQQKPKLHISVHKHGKNKKPIKY